MQWAVAKPTHTLGLEYGQPNVAMCLGNFEASTHGLHGRLVRLSQVHIVVIQLKTCEAGLGVRPPDPDPTRVRPLAH